MLGREAPGIVDSRLRKEIVRRALEQFETETGSVDFWGNLDYYLDDPDRLSGLIRDWYQPIGRFELTDEDKAYVALVQRSVLWQAISPANR